MITKSDYREILKEEFENKRKRNENYSLRAFARDLNISAARLSSVLNGRFGLSRNAAKKITDKLNFNNEEKDYFCTLVESKHARSKFSRETARIKLEKYNAGSEKKNLTLDSFKIISDWYHFAILELTYLKQFKYDITWIAKQLNISVIECELAIKRLKRLDLLIEKNNTLAAFEEETFAPVGIPSKSKKEFLSQLLEKSINALHFQFFEDRDYSANIISFDKNRINEVKQKIREYKDELTRYINCGDSKNDVYCLSIQFFSLINN